MLAHLQATCGGLHDLDVLSLQNEMQQYHLDCEGIPEYVNALEDAQDKVERPNNLITDATLDIIATNAMLRKEKFPCANENWEYLDVSQHTRSQ